MKKLVLILLAVAVSSSAIGQNGNYRNIDKKTNHLSSSFSKKTSEKGEKSLFQNVGKQNLPADLDMPDIVPITVPYDEALTFTAEDFSVAPDPSMPFLTFKVKAFTFTLASEDDLSFASNADPANQDVLLLIFDEIPDLSDLMVAFDAA
ncbi:MAG: hypothetical protein LBN95_05630, partial [Prevotellaceae bacterium]|nr:hypothetical protein [Prevotellaceae bacterium]